MPDSNANATPAPRANWVVISVVTAGLLGAILAAILASAPRKDGALDWSPR
jgi:hypothetical protein